MVRSETDTLARFRSLLQKAVRRGNANLVVTTCAILESFGAREKNWIRGRAAIITFEESWPLGVGLVFNKRFHSKVAALVRVARCQKSKDASGLGLLAHALFEDDRSVLNGSRQDRDLKIIANAIGRPDAFWEWVLQRGETKDQVALIRHAHQFRKIGLPKDNAIIQSAAYLGSVGPLPEVNMASTEEKTFPYWVALDYHTTEGRRTLRDISRDLHIELPQLEWIAFYSEGNKTNDMCASPWWDRYCAWRFQKIGIPIEEAPLLWVPVRPQVMAALEEESHQLHKDIYRWKMDHMDRIRHLRQQVDLFLAHFDEVQRDQLEIF